MFELYNYLVPIFSGMFKCHTIEKQSQNLNSVPSAQVTNFNPTNQKIAKCNPK